MARQRRIADRLQTQTEVNRRHQDAIASIDDEISEGIRHINWDRRSRAEKSFYEWVCTYGFPGLLQTLPPPNARAVLDKLESSLEMSKPLQLQLHRGCGKSVYCQLFLLYQISTGRRRYPVIISANARAAMQLLTDIFRFVVEDGTAWAQDYPTLHVPHAICQGSYRRRQLYAGKPTNISRTAADISFADISVDGQPGVCHISARGITSGLRGMRKGSIRVDSVLLDDLLGEDDTSEQATDKLWTIINKSVLNLGSAAQKITVAMTSTSLAPDDLTQKIKQDKNWVTVVYPAVINWGNIDGPEWKKYWEIYDDESVRDVPHRESDEFYKENFETLEKGFELYNPQSFSPSENVSGVQALMQKRHLIGDDAFACEFQLQPKKYSAALEINPRDVLSRIGTTPKLCIPDDSQMVIMSVDLNTSRYLTAVCISFDRHLTGTVIWHEVFKCHVSSKLPQVEYNQQVYNLLAEYSRRIARLGIKIDYLVYDAGGSNFDSVTSFAGNARIILGDEYIPTAGFTGRASHIFNPNVKSRIRSASGRTVLCASEDGKRKWVAWDSDYYRATVQRALLLETGAMAGLQLYDAPESEHREYALQICDEKLLYIQHRETKDIYFWKSAHGALQHDYLDATAQAYACAAQMSLGVDIIDAGPVKAAPRTARKIASRPRFRMR